MPTGRCGSGWTPWHSPAPGLDELCRRPDADPPVSLRWVLLHLLEETARHAGHADIIRELIDGGTGRLPPRPHLP